MMVSRDVVLFVVLLILAVIVFSMLSKRLTILENEDKESCDGVVINGNILIVAITGNENVVGNENSVSSSGHEC